MLAFFKYYCLCLRDLGHGGSTLLESDNPDVIFADFHIVNPLRKLEELLWHADLAIPVGHLIQFNREADIVLGMVEPLLLSHLIFSAWPPFYGIHF